MVFNSKLVLIPSGLNSWTIVIPFFTVKRFYPLICFDKDRGLKGKLV